MNIAGKRTVITGGSSGIGLAMAQALGAKGARLLLTGRRTGPLEAAPPRSLVPATGSEALTC